ncbi:MAG: tRNA (N6-threonylcarbamoyladenosine(37)-N6)-methyltransferase TrmO [Bacteroidales bacterium]|nr:MAG: tRNA (N6-threonylcarbamoyladenosine(37)-N6)-methyltransferase TrmO [Bacteroidales bacterium]
MKIEFKSIGTIHSHFKKKEGMPIQSIGAKGIKGFIRIKKNYIAGLKDLDGFSHIYLIYYFHKSNGFELHVTPFLDNKPHGVFATRVPKRPNSVGISVVKLLSIKKNILEIENVDIIDGTPLLDIKPYIPQFDIHSVDKNGWVGQKADNLNDILSDNRFE